MTAEQLKILSRVQIKLSAMSEEDRIKATTPKAVNIWDNMPINSNLEIGYRYLYNNKCYEVTTNYNIGENKEFIKENFKNIYMENRRIKAIKNN